MEIALYTQHREGLNYIFTEVNYDGYERVQLDESYFDPLRRGYVITKQIVFPDCKGNGAKIDHWAIYHNGNIVTEGHIEEPVYINKSESITLAAGIKFPDPKLPELSGITD